MVVADAGPGPVLMAVVPTALVAAQTTFFVSPPGDANAGTSSSCPVRTLARAWALVRS
jgi:hypothetical protein